MLPNRSTAANYDAPNKINDQNQPPANQPLDWDNTKLGQCTADVAAVGLTSPRIWLRCTLAASTGALVVQNWWAQWANVSETAPIPSRTSTGVFTFTLPTMVSNEYTASFGQTDNIPVALNAAKGSLEGSTPGFVNASASGNVITVNTFGSGGSASDLVSSVLFLVAY